MIQEVEIVRQTKELLDEVKRNPKEADTAKLAMEIYSLYQSVECETSWQHLKNSVLGVKV